MSQVPVRKRAEGVSESTEVVHEMDLFIRDNPRSVINLVPAEVQAKIFVAYKERPELFRLAEKQLRKEVKPNPTDSRMRLAFWNEFNLAQETGSPMRMSSVHAGICTRQFFEWYITQTPNLAWLLCPPSSYIVALEELVNRSQNKLSEILEADVIGEDGKVDVKLGELVLKIHLAAEARLKGSVLERKKIVSETTNKNLNLNANVPLTDDQAEKAQAEVSKVVREGSIADVNSRLERLRKEDARRERAREKGTGEPGTVGGGDAAG